MRYLLVLMLAGCGTWTKDGGTTKQFQGDYRNCERKAELNGIMNSSILSKCMTDLGYEKR